MIFESISTSIDQSKMLNNEFGLDIKTSDMFYGYSKQLSTLKV